MLFICVTLTGHYTGKVNCHSAKSGALLACSVSAQWTLGHIGHFMCYFGTWPLSAKTITNTNTNIKPKKNITSVQKKNVSLLPLWLVATGGASTPLVHRPLCFSCVIVVYRGSFKVSFHVLLFSACPLSDSWPLGKHTTSCLLFMCYFGTWPLGTTRDCFLEYLLYLVPYFWLSYMFLCGGLAATHRRHTSCSVVPFEGDGRQ